MSVTGNKTITLDPNMQKEVDRLNARLHGADVIKRYQDYLESAPNVDGLSEAEKQSAMQLQRDWRDRWRNLWIPRRDNMRAEYYHHIEGIKVAFGSGQSLFQIAFNYRNPMAVITNILKFSLGTFNEIRNYIRKGEHVRADSEAMQNLMWDHANTSAMSLLLRRPVKDASKGIILEVDDARDVLMGAFNDDLINAKKLNGTPVNEDNRILAAKLLRCKFGISAEGKIEMQSDDTRSQPPARPAHQQQSSGPLPTAV